MKKYVSTTEAAEILGISHVAVYKKVKEGKIPAQKVGRNFIIDRNDLGGIYREITPKDEREIEKAVSKVFKEYGPVLRKLSKE